MNQQSFFPGSFDPVFFVSFFILPVSLCPDFYIERCKGYTLTKAIKEQSDGNDAVSDGYEFNKYYAGKRMLYGR